MGNDIIQAQVTRRIVLAAPIQVGPPEDRVLRLCISDESRDRYKSIIRCDGWKTDNYAKNPVALFAHDSSQPPIGSGKAFSTLSESRPYVTQHPKRTMDSAKQGKFSRWFSDTQFAKRETYPFADIIYKLFIDKHLRATSVGFNPLDSKQLNHEDQLGEDWARDLTELQIGDVVHRMQELLEYSAVPIPGNQNAVVESLKLWVPGLRSLETKTADCVRSFLATPAITDDGWMNAAELDLESDFSKTCREFQGLLFLTRELMAAEPQSETRVTSGWTKEIEAIQQRLEQGAGTESKETPVPEPAPEPEVKEAVAADAVPEAPVPPNATEERVNLRKAAQPAPASGQDPESNPDPAADADQEDHEQGEITDREELRETLQEAISDIDDATGRIQEALGMLDDADHDDQDQMDNVRPEDAEPATLSGASGKSEKGSQPGQKYSLSYLQISTRFDEHHSSGGDFISGDHRAAAYGAMSASGHHRAHGSFHDTMALKHGEDSDKGKVHGKAGELHHELSRGYDRHSTLHHAAADLRIQVEQEKQGKSIGPNAVQPLGNASVPTAETRGEPIADEKRLGEMLQKSGKAIVGKRQQLHDHLKGMADAGHHANPGDCRDYRSYDAPKERMRTLPSTRLIETLMAQAFQKAATEVRNQLMPCLNGLAKRSELSTFMVDLDEVKRSLRELSARSFSVKSPAPPPAPKAPASGGEPKEPDRKAAAEHHEKLLRETRSTAAALLARMDSLVAASAPPDSGHPVRGPKFPHTERRQEPQK